MATSNVTPPVARTQRSIRFGRPTTAPSAAPAETPPAAVNQPSVGGAAELDIMAAYASLSSLSEGPATQGAASAADPASFDGINDSGKANESLPGNINSGFRTREDHERVKAASATVPSNHLPAKPPLTRAQRFASAAPENPRSEGAPAQQTSDSSPGHGPSEGAAEFARQQLKTLDSIRTQGVRGVNEVKRSMAAAKVLTPLVASISFNPGFDGSQAERTQTLTTLLKEVHSTAEQTAMKISEAFGRDVPQWMVTQLMQALSEAVASQWQRSGTLQSSVLADAMKVIFSDTENLSGLIENTSLAAYQEVKSFDVARDRVTTSTVSAAWRIYDWVTHPQLAVDPSGISPSVFFTYGMEPMDLVNKILTRCVDEARAFLLEVGDPDLRVSHLQASIARMSALVGAEYVTQTRHVMTWISEGATPEVQDERRALAQAQLETRILPHVFEWARQNFVRIEDGALSAMEVFHDQKTENQTIATGAAGPAARGSGDGQPGQ